MTTVQRLFFASMVMLALAAVAIAGEQAGPAALSAPATVNQAKFPVTLKAGDYVLTSSILEFAPGAGVSRHMHGGQVLVLVLSGEMTLREKGGERVLKGGESWTEEPGNEHSVVNAGNETAWVAVSMLLPKGAEATTIIK